MTLTSLSSCANAGLAAIAAAAARDALRGAADDGDPIMATLYLEARQYMHGVCALLASHLQESRDLPVVLIQGHPPGQTWLTRHAMACGCDAQEAAALIAAGRGLELPVLDAAGAGSLGDRMPLYRKEGWRYQAILARDTRCTSRWMWEPRAGRPLSNCEGAIGRLPALALALGAPFDLREALTGILADLDAIPAEIEASGLLEGLGLGHGPARP